MLSFQYGTTTINYSIEYQKNKKDVSISVALDEGIKLTVPEGIGSEKIQSILYQKAPWILKKKSELDEVILPTSQKEYVSGEKFPYLGRHYRLKVHKNENSKMPTLNFLQGRFIAEVPDIFSETEKVFEMKLKFKEWYIQQGHKKVRERLKIYCPKMRLDPLKVTFKDQERRWGSCTKDGAVYLNWRIMMAPMTIVDYVLVHELAHIKHQAHSPYFWRFVRSVLPDYEQRKEWLRINGPTLFL